MSAPGDARAPDTGPALLVGTAGHVDHGKTALLRALTGIDCDRWAEEKRRGITLDLGFAHLLRDGVEIGFVDVPGHQRFLDNALAGLGGIRLLLLVVAADEGVKPQTREHLSVAELLGIPEALVVLTKLDLADGEIADLVELEVAELLAPTRFRGARVLRTSTETGEGIEALARELVERARRAAPLADAGPARLPVDRAFVLEGRGLVATGTLVAGAVAPGDTLELLPAGRSARVRSLEIHGRPRERARAGQRAAVRLAGLERGEVGRGDELVAPGAYAVARRLLARISWSADATIELDGRLPVRVHLFAAQRLGVARPLAPGRLAPGATGLVELRLARPLVAARGDRLIVRRLSPAATLGGGEVLDSLWRRPRHSPVEAFAGETPRALAAWVAEGGPAGDDARSLARRLGRHAEEVARELESLAADGKLVAGPGAAPADRRYFSPARLAAFEKAAAQRLAALAARDRLAEGASRAEWLEGILPANARDLADFHVAWLTRRGVVEAAGDRVRPPGRGPSLSGEETGLAAAIVERYERAGLEAPSPGELARELGATPEIVEGLIRHLVGKRRLARLPSGLILAASTLEKVVSDLRRSAPERFSVGWFKDRFALSRKWAIPLLEHLDSTGVTRRLGDERVLRAPSAEAARDGS
jgi:selenocysteine-specific elongation factor